MTGTSKSPLGLMNELLRDDAADQTVLQNPFPPCLLLSQSFVGSNGFFRVRAGIPVEARLGRGNPCPIFEAEAVSERSEAQTCPKAASSALVELLEMRRGCVQLAGTSSARGNVCDVTKGYWDGTAGEEQTCTRGTVCGGLNDFCVL